LEIPEVSFGCLEIKIIAEESHPEKFVLTENQEGYNLFSSWVIVFLMKG